MRAVIEARELGGYVQSNIGLRQVALVVVVALVSAQSACTPIKDPNHGGHGGDAAAHGGGPDANTDAATISGEGAPPDLEQPCEADGIVACRGTEDVGRVICKSHAWETYSDCKSNEVCVTDAGSVHGDCKTLANECTGREPRVPFCDGSDLRVCSDPTESNVTPCGANSSCRTIDGESRCTCAPGAVDMGSGCEASSVCSPMACDALTKCVEKNGRRSCTDCPDGYTGTGEDGCSPLLLGLDLSCGALSMTLTKDQFDYHIDSTLFCQTLTLTPHVPPGIDVEINGQKLAAAAAWTSGFLELGDNPVSIMVAAASGLTTRYNITVTRAGKQEAFVKARNPGQLDRLGASVAIDNGIVVAGAPYEDGAAGGVNADPSSGTLDDSGAVYVFMRKGAQWVQDAYLKADKPRQGEFFGSSVAILGDTIAVGATGNDPTSQPAVSAITGAVYLFKRTGTTWAQVKRLVADDTTSSDMFGFQVLLTADKLLVTAPFESSMVSKSGAAYVFERVGDDLQKSAKLKSSRPFSLAGWGTGLAYDGTTIAIGAFSDGQTVMNAGSGSVFTQQGGAWKEQQFLQADKPVQGATFGLSMAVLGDTLIVGAPRWGHYIQTPSGEVYVFKRSGEHWTQTMVMEAFSPRPQDFFGSALVLTPTLLLIGANGDASGSAGVQANASDNSALASGAVYFFERDGDQFVKPIFIKPAHPSMYDSFGVAIALSGDMLASAAAYDDDDDSGAVYVLR